MKIAVMNYSGNVGKSTLTRHLLAPRLPDAEVIAVETVNADESAQGGHVQIPATAFDALQQRWLLADEVIVDVGASNVEQFVARMAESEGSHEDFDLFVIPTVAEDKQMRDTRKTIDTLFELGVPAERVRLVFNKVPRAGVLVSTAFGRLYELHRQERTFILDPAAIVYESKVYAMASMLGKNVAQVCADPTDYSAELAKTTDRVKRQYYAEMIGVRRLALKVQAELDTLFMLLVVRPSADPLQ